MKVLLLICCAIITGTLAGSINGIDRPKCQSREVLEKYRDIVDLSEYENRLKALQDEMQARASPREAINAYIVTSYDEHQANQPGEIDGRLMFISGFSGSFGHAVITANSAALWTDLRHLELANEELECHWKIFNIEEDPTMAMWLAKQIKSRSLVGADPRTTPHQLWQEWEKDLEREFLKLSKTKNLIDIVWGPNRVYKDFSINYHNSTFSGYTWQSKVNALRTHLHKDRCDALIITSLTEIAYLLNLRGYEYKYTPVFHAYLIVTQKQAILYTDKTKVSLGVEMMMKFDFKTESCYSLNCVIIKNYYEIWEDLRSMSREWRRVLLPTMSTFDMGVSEEIYSMFNRNHILEKPSPVVEMRAQKNTAEREGMRNAHIRDAVAIIETLCHLKERYKSGDSWTELYLENELVNTRYNQTRFQGLSQKTIVAFGPHAAKPIYYPSNHSTEITRDNLLLIDSGAQYLDGTTSFARSIHLGKPTDEQKRAYTEVLQGLVRLSMLVFPDNLSPAEIDSLIRGPVWTSRHDYQHLSGNGIGSFLSVEESPINIAYTSKNGYVFKEGNFFTVAPGYYKANEFGIRLKNVFEVVDTKDRHAKFLAFSSTTLLPFQNKLIDRSMLSQHEKKWLNDYNARIRESVGEELKKQLKMTAFYWLMNQTEYIREYLTETEYEQSQKLQTGTSESSVFNISLFVVFISTLVMSFTLN